MRVEEYFKNYPKFMLCANIGAIVYFFYALILNVVLRGDDIFRFTIMSASLIIGVIVSGLCFADFFSLEVVDYKRYENRKELMKKAFLHEYESSFLKYTAINYIIGFSAIVINTVYDRNDESFYKDNIPNSIKWFVIITMVIAIIFLIGSGTIDLHEKKLRVSGKIGGRKRGYTFVTPLPFLMLVGGEDLLIYLIFILWIGIFVIPTVRKERISKNMMKELWRKKHIISDHFMRNFTQARNGKEIALQAYPYFIIPFLFSYIMNDQLNLKEQTLIIADLIIIYYTIKSLRKESKIRIPVGLAGITLVISTVLYVVILNEQSISLIKTATLFTIGGYAIKNYSIAALIFGVILYGFVTSISILILKLKEKEGSKVLFAVIISDVELIGIPLIFFSYLLIQREAIKYVNQLLIVGIIYTVTIFLLTILVKAKNELQLLMKIAEKNNFALLEKLSEGYCKISLTAMIYRNKLKMNSKLI